jgi:carbonic anhydrase
VRTTGPQVADHDEVDRLLAANQQHVEARARVADARPSRRLAVVTCMDARIDVFAAFGIQLGEAHVIRNAGGRVTDDVLRSLTLSSHLLGITTVVVMQHTRCGLAGVTNDELRARTGADYEFLPINDHRATLREDVERIAGSAHLALIEHVAAFVYDVETGGVEQVVGEVLGKVKVKVQAG